MPTRSDLIYTILSSSPSQRLHVSEIGKKLALIEGIDAKYYPAGIISATVRADSQTRKKNGLPKRFNYSGQGSTEARGYISVSETQNCNKKEIQKIIDSIYQSNDKAVAAFRRKMQRMDWQEFKDTYLAEILCTALGSSSLAFHCDISEDKTDSVYIIEKGITQTPILLSGKYWQAEAVNDLAIQRMRGIRGEYDTSVIITSFHFSPPAFEEAKPIQNQRSVVLVDIDFIVKTLFKNQSGVKAVLMPPLFELE